jgi:Family of unknown function (DUF5946)
MNLDLRTMSELCTGCGLAVEGEKAGCRRLFEELGAREWDSPTSYRLHRMMVDAYSLQHPEEYCASAKSFAAHLTGMCCAFEHKSHPAVMKAIQQWLSGKVHIVRPEAPAKRGELTVMDAYRERDPVPHMIAVNRWAESAWNAYAALHPLAREWVKQAMERPGRPTSAGKK